MRHLVSVALGLGLVSCSVGARRVEIGSKAFTESYVLAEVAVGALEHAGFAAHHRPGMGGTIILWEALRQGAVDAYPDYTGTIVQEILHGRGGATLDDLRTELGRHGVDVTAPLGFNNSYALVMRSDRALELGVSNIGDLRDHPELRVGLTHEFLGRRDGWRPLSERYGLAMSDVVGIEHALAYRALDRGDIDVMDAYTTDAELARHDLVLLTDDLAFFPRYDAVFLYRTDLDPAAVAVLENLGGSINETTMVRLNALAEDSGDPSRAAAELLSSRAASPNATLRPSAWRRIAGWTLRHLQLVGASLILAILVGVPLGIAAARGGIGGQAIISITGVLYTVPSLALLAVLAAIPFLGIATRTAIVALFLYSLLPIVRNTATGLQTIPQPIRDSAEALGLEAGARLARVYLPIAMPTILAGIKTAAIINVATATLAALIGVGGLGEPIIAGLNLNDPGLILQGAVPAALLAVAVQLAFDGVERLVVPRGLRARHTEARH